MGEQCWWRAVEEELGMGEEQKEWVDECGRGEDQEEDG